jgi:membrane-bound serine protease (ClpP class)
MLTAMNSVIRGARPAGWLVAAVLLLAATASVRGQDETKPGRVLSVDAPITPGTVGTIREAITEALKRSELNRGKGLFTVILDFNPDGRRNSSKDFGPCYALADYLLNKLQGQGVHTVAYVHGEVTGHSVLPVLACSEIVFSNGGELGDVVRDPGETLPEVERTAYRVVASHRLPEALIRKMYDRDLVVVRTADPAGERYRDARDVKAGEPVLRAGTIARYNFAQASAFGICEAAPRENVRDVAAAYTLGPDALRNDPLPGRKPLAWLIAVGGPVNGQLKEQLPRRVGKALKADASTVIFVISCHGGDSESAADISAYIEGLKKSGLRTVAYVTHEAADTAAFPALSCDRIILQPKAKLGGFDNFLLANPGRADVVCTNLLELATRQSYPPLLVRAFADPGLQLYRVVPVRGGAAQFISKSELNEDLARPERQWKDERLVKGDDGKCLTLDADAAKSFGLADSIEEDVSGVWQLEGLEQLQVHDATRDRDWLDDLATFLRDPWTSVVLVMVGITCLILELKMPGTTLPGIVAAVCFVLFFWSHSQLNGQITWLALLLFVLGLLLIGLEMFILPGVGVAGISGTVLVLGSLGLVAYGHWPQSNEDWVAFGRTIGPFGISVLGAMILAFVLARFLPSIPFANRLMLKPIGGADEFGEEASGPSLGGPDLTELLGAVGVAATPLRPAGKVQFGDEFIDVVAEGGYVPPGARVQVIEIEGIRVVVKEV